jgi:hypothetical protein
LALRPVATVEELVPFDDEDDEARIRKPAGGMDSGLDSGFVRELPEVIEFGVTQEGASPLLAEMRRNPGSGDGSCCWSRLNSRLRSTTERPGAACGRLSTLLPGAAAFREARASLRR